MATRNIVPRATGEGSIGTAAKHWGAGHFDTLPNWQEYLAESTGYGIVSGCTPTISGLTVTVAAGVVHLADGTRKEISATNITLDNADPSNPRIDLVYIDSTGVVAKITGTAAASPSVPTLPSGGISVCNVTVAAGATTGTVTDTMQINKRVITPDDFSGNDTEKIQGALNSLAENGGILALNRSYLIDGPITIKHFGSNIEHGQLVVVGINKAVIYCMNQAKILGYTAHCGGVTFENVTFIAIGTNCNLFKLNGYLIRLRFLACKFKSFYDVFASANASDNNYNFVQELECCNCSFRDIEHSIFYNEYATEKIIFENNMCQGVGTAICYGLNIKGSSNLVKINGNTFEDFGSAIYMESIDSNVHTMVSIHSNYFESNYYSLNLSGITGYPGMILFTENRIMGSGEFGSKSNFILLPTDMNLYGFSSNHATWIFKDNFISYNLYYHVLTAPTVNYYAIDMGNLTEIQISMAYLLREDTQETYTYAEKFYKYVDDIPQLGSRNPITSDAIYKTRLKSLNLLASETLLANSTVNFTVAATLGTYLLLCSGSSPQVRGCWLLFRGNTIANQAVIPLISAGSSLSLSCNETLNKFTLSTTGNDTVYHLFSLTGNDSITVS